MDETGLRGKRNNKATETANFFSNFSRENGLFFSSPLFLLSLQFRRKREDLKLRGTKKSLRAEISLRGWFRGKTINSRITMHSGDN